MLCEECGSNNPKGSPRCLDCGSLLANNEQTIDVRSEEVARDPVASEPSKSGKTIAVGITEAKPAVNTASPSESALPAAVEGRTSRTVVPIEPVHVYGPSESSLKTTAPRPDYSVSPASTFRRNRIPMMVIATVALTMITVAGAIAYVSRAKKIPNEIPVAPPPVYLTPPKPKNPTPVPDGMILIPGGVFSMGRNDGDGYSAPAHSVTVQPFYIDRTEVTNAAYQQFVRSTNHQAPPDWINGQYPGGKDNLPVVRVTWYDAAAYAQWAGKRLPTETEWEFAARGNDGRLYPWGNAWQPQFAITKEAGTAGPVAVGSRPDGASPFGVLDLCGNVIEWVADDFRPYPDSRAQARKETFKVLRGGGFRTPQNESDATYRSYNYLNYKDIYGEIGFRCAKDIAPNE